MKTNYIFKTAMVLFLFLGTFSTYAQTVVKYEAENATLNGASLATDQAGYSGTGFVAAFGNSGDFIEYTVSGVTAGMILSFAMQQKRHALLIYM